MAENNYCVSRYRYTDGKPDTTFVGHHEWRFRQETIEYVGSPPEGRDYDTYYCVFCLQLKHMRIASGPTTQYR